MVLAPEAVCRMAKAFAYINGREYVIPEDIKALAVPVLAHRLILKGGSMGSKAESVIEDILSKTEVPTEDWSK